MYCMWWALAFSVAQMTELSPSDPVATTLLAITQPLYGLDDI